MIANTLRNLAARGETALIPYVMGGFPTLSESMRHLRTVAASGADMIEIGVPFSDPVADGPTIEQAAHRALAAGARLVDILDAVAGLEPEVPRIVMSYLNPLLAVGRDEVLDRLREAGVSGLIVPDLPLEESDPWLAGARLRGIALIYLVAPTSSDARVREAARRSDGFLYYVSVTGTTGTRRDLPADITDALDRLARLTDVPRAVGFGVATPDHVRRLHGRAQGVVVGSRIIEAIARGQDLAALVRELKQATRRSHAGGDETGRS